MNKMKDSRSVTEQYGDSKNLDIRISLHTKYSENKQSFGDWIFEQYRFADGYRILELGCGNGNMWINNAARLPQNSQLILSDFSEGMLNEAKGNVPSSEKISFQIVDVQNIPYADNSFDAVIANMMLYHVPDLKKALGEIKRVLKRDGTFYSATYGENGIIEYVERELPELFESYTEKNKLFTIQNGGKLLSEFFGEVTLIERADALNVSSAEDLADYIFSCGTIIDIKKISRDELCSRLEAKKRDGAIHIPKEYGIFISINK